MIKDRFHGLRILVCEDEALQSLAFSRILLEAGAEVEVSRTGEEAVSIAAKHRPDLVMMDIELPGFDGLEAMRQIKSQAATCIIMVTAYADEETIQRAFDAGADGYLLKPISVAQVADLWEELRGGDAEPKA